MIPEGFEFGWMPANSPITRKNDPAFAACHLKPLLIRGIGSKTLVVSNIVRADLVQRFAQKAAPGATIDK